MMHPGLRWWEPRPISFSGFLAVATESMLAPSGGDGQRRLGDRSYAIVAEAYCNFSSRIGYHFAAVDAHCSESRTRNYISFRFKGGAADDDRRARRCELIGDILRRLDFQIERNGDRVNARLRKFPREEVIERLDQLGRLIVATRQLDMRLGPGTPVAWYVEAFFDGNYLFEPSRPPAGSETTSERRERQPL
jgi:pyruvate, water dikinase